LTRFLSTASAITLPPAPADQLGSHDGVGDYDAARLSSPAALVDSVGDQDVARLTAVPGLVPANSLRRLTPARLSQCRQHSSTLSTSEVNPRSVSHRDSTRTTHSSFETAAEHSHMRYERSLNLICLLFCEFSQTISPTWSCHPTSL